MLDRDAERPADDAKPPPRAPRWCVRFDRGGPGANLLDFWLHRVDYFATFELPPAPSSWAQTASPGPRPASAAAALSSACRDCGDGCGGGGGGGDGGGTTATPGRGGGGPGDAGDKTPPVFV